MQKMFDKWILNTKRLFLMDGLGAFITAFLLFAILRNLNEYFGMPKKVFTALSILALAFCIYSISCFLLVNKSWKPFLKVIIIANLIYCCFTLWLLFFYYQQLTILGFAYFLLEIGVISLLVYFEIYAVINK